MKEREKQKALEKLEKLTEVGSLTVGDSAIRRALWPLGLKFYDLWCAKRAGRKAPERKDFRPAEMVPLLPSISLYSVEKNPQRFKIILMGTEFSDSAGIDLTGKYMDEVPGGDMACLRAGWMVKYCEPLLVQGVPLAWSRLDYKRYDAVGLPLAGGGGAVDKFFYFNKFYI